MKRNNTAERSHYEIGKGKPPKKYKWRPGQSGNARGRPKGAKNIATIFARELARRVQIQENGRTKVLSVKELIVRRIINSALKGEHKAIAMMIALEPQIARASTVVEMITHGISIKEAAERYERTLKIDDDEDE
jgi:hypothetical protein